MFQSTVHQVNISHSIRIYMDMKTPVTKQIVHTNITIIMIILVHICKTSKVTSILMFQRQDMNVRRVIVMYDDKVAWCTDIR